MKIQYAGLFAILAATSISAPTPVRAAPVSPWCLRVVTSGLSVDKCEYRTFEKCNQERISEGNRSYCFQNPALTFGPASDGRGKGRH